MNEQDVLAKIIEVVEPLSEITMETVIEDHDDLDSLAIFNLIQELKAEGVVVPFPKANRCRTVSDLVKLILEHSAA